jgi:hypothetical protein
MYLEGTSSRTVTETSGTENASKTSAASSLIRRVIFCVGTTGSRKSALQMEARPIGDMGGRIAATLQPMRGLVQRKSLTAQQSRP